MATDKHRKLFIPARESKKYSVGYDKKVSNNVNQASALDCQISTARIPSVDLFFEVATPVNSKLFFNYMILTYKLYTNLENDSQLPCIFEHKWTNRNIWHFTVLYYYWETVGIFYYSVCVNIIRTNKNA